MAWAGVTVAEWGSYLGFAEGPGKGEHSWSKPMKKYRHRSELWGAQPLGLQYGAMTYNTFVASVLSFVCQLASPTEVVKQAEVAALRKAAPGPAWWAKPEDLFYLKELYGQTRSFKSIEAVALAAQVRVATWEATNAGGLRVMERACLLRDLFGTAEYMGRRNIWSSWYANSHILILERALSQFEALGTSVKALVKELSGDARQPWNEKFTNSVKKRFQQAALGVILKARQSHAEERIRHKVERWRLQGLPGANARRILKRLALLKTLVTPSSFLSGFEYYLQ